MEYAKLKKEFVDEMPHTFRRKIGRSIATSLSGFIAGVVVTSIFLLPPLFLMSKLCPSK